MWDYKVRMTITKVQFIDLCESQGCCRQTCNRNTLFSYHSVMLKVCLSSSYSALTAAAPISMRKCEFRAQYNISRSLENCHFHKLIEQNSLNGTENYICFCISYKLAEENSRWRFQLGSALQNDCMIPRGTFLFHSILHWTAASCCGINLGKISFLRVI